MNMYTQALAVQDACNLSGVVKSFSRLLDEIWEEVRLTNGGTNEVNEHPVCILFCDKMAQLAGLQSTLGGHVIEKAYEFCHRRVDSEEQNALSEVASDDLLDAETEIKDWCDHWTVSNDDPKCKHPAVRLAHDDFPYCDNRWCPIRQNTSKTERNEM